MFFDVHNVCTHFMLIFVTVYGVNIGADSHWERRPCMQLTLRQRYAMWRAHLGYRALAIQCESGPLIHRP